MTRRPIKTTIAGKPLLDPEMLYPLYDPETQARKYAAGEYTHKLPSEMTDRERKRVERREIRRQAKQS
jgi:hypothetical protein